MIEIAPAIERLGVPAYNWWNEALHGIARSGDSVTVFPQAIGMAATFDVESVKLMGQIVSDEARAIYNKTLQDNKTGNRYKGLTFWTPNINIFRDPRWGRGQETYGEDPFLTGQLGKAIVEGLQGDDPNYLKTSACAKHFAIHSGPESSRHTFDVSVSNYDLWNTYLPAFRDLVVDAKVSSIMCAYNRYNGKPCCGSENLMINILRNQWNFKGYVTSDCGAINDFWKTHKTDIDGKNASANAVMSGTDLECGEYWSKLWSYKSLPEAVKDGLIDEKKLDESVARLFTIRFRLGMFDPKDKVPYNKIPYSNLKLKYHEVHALKMARQSLVLLKNNSILPLSKKIKTIAIVGPNANDKKVLYGNYNGVPRKTVTVLAGIKAKLGNDVNVIFEQGITPTKLIDPTNSIQQIAQKVSKADLVIFVGGISARLEGEEGDAGKEPTEGFFCGDRTIISLPKIQTALMQEIKLLGKPLVFVNMSGSAISMEWENTHANAILQAWYGGQSAGTAIADVLFGDYNPSGRLPITFYKSEKDLPEFTDYSMSNRTYRYFKGEVIYPFGYGLSYSTYEYSALKVTKTLNANGKINVSVTVQNKGKLAGEEVVQLYISSMSKNENKAIQSLKAIKRIYLLSGEKKRLNLALDTKQLCEYDENGKLNSLTGDYCISVGGGQPAKSNLRSKTVVQSIVSLK
jgi:beta-glucosidase